MASRELGSNPINVRIAWHCTCFNTRRAARVITQFYDDIMAPSGVKAIQFTMLGAVAMTGPASITGLADRLGLDRTTLTRNLKPVVEAGLVEMRRGDDRRERVVSLTETGREAVARATPYWHEAQDRVVELLGEERWRGMLEDMNEISAMIAAERA